MQDQRIESIDITPDKSIYHKIGEANYSISDAVAELVDNSIDAAKEDGVIVLIVLDKRNGKIIIRDNGKGMDKETASKALVLAHSIKHDSLGEFGLGLKSACTSLGTHFKVATTPDDSTEQYVLEYDRDEFVKDSDWKKYPLKIETAPKKGHGTLIEISKLKVKLYDALVTRLKDDLSRRYGPYIKHNNVVIKVGMRENTAKPCEPALVKLVKDSRQEFEYVLSNGSKINGWHGLLEVGSQKMSGFNLFRRGRLIRSAEKLGYNYHPSLMSITGEIHMNPVPVTHNKREFILESPEFKEFIQEFWGDQTEKYMGYRVKGRIDDITRTGRERSNKQKAEDALKPEVRETIKNNVLEALNRLDDFKELAFPDGMPAKRDDKGRLHDMEKRSQSLKIAQEEPIQEPQDTKDKRTPRKTQPRMAKFIMVGGNKYRFDFDLRNLGNDEIDKETIISEQRVIEIYINTGFKGYTLTNDTSFYTIFHISEAIAEIYVKENKLSADKVFELRNNLLHEVASVILEEEELQNLKKTEHELEEIKKKRSEIEKRKAETSLR